MIDQRLCDQLAPFAQRYRSYCLTADRKRTRVRIARRQVERDLWAEAYRQGLTRFAVPPLLVSLLCRALWLVITHWVEQILEEPGSDA